MHFSYEQFIMDLNFALPCCKILAFVCLPKTPEILLSLDLILNVTAVLLLDAQQHKCHPLQYWYILEGNTNR
jgi:hypothetical protein